MSYFSLNKKFQQIERYYRHFTFKKTLIKVVKVIFLRIYAQSVFIVGVKDLTEEMKFSFKYKLIIQRIE